MRVLGVDFGFERIGLAVGESDPGVISPRPPRQAEGALRRDADALALVCRAEEADAVVLGIPLEEGGVEGRMARVVRQLAGHLTERGVRVLLIDETLTSVGAEQTMIEAGLKASDRRKRRDSEAACRIVERYFDGEATID